MKKIITLMMGVVILSTATFAQVKVAVGAQSGFSTTWDNDFENIHIPVGLWVDVGPIGIQYGWAGRDNLKFDEKQANMFVTRYSNRYESQSYSQQIGIYINGQKDYNETEGKFNTSIGFGVQRVKYYDSREEGRVRSVDLVENYYPYLIWGLRRSIGEMTDMRFEMNVGKTVSVKVGIGVTSFFGKSK